MRILITGGCGFIGSHLAEFHLEKGDEVYVVDDLSTGSIENIVPFQKNPHFRFEQADILTWSNLDKAVSWADRIYHMAAVIGVFLVISEPIKVLETNINGYRRVLDAVVKSSSHPRIIVASSSSVYGDSPNKILSEDNESIVGPPSYPLRNYAISKLADEGLSLAYTQKNNLAITTIRIFNCIGPRQTGQYGMVVPRFVKQACHNDPLTVFGDGTQTRSFCDVRDLIVALSMLAENEATIGEIINIGNDSEITINELAEIVRTLANSKSKIEYQSYVDAYGKNFVDIKNRRPDLTKLFHFTSFKHKWTLQDTIADLISRYKQ